MQFDNLHEFNSMLNDSVNICIYNNRIIFINGKEFDKFTGYSIRIIRDKVTHLRKGDAYLE